MPVAGFGSSIYQTKKTLKVQQSRLKLEWNLLSEKKVTTDYNADVINADFNHLEKSKLIVREYSALVVMLLKEV